MFERPRRNRKNHAMRSLMRENIIKIDDLIAPLFVIDGKGVNEPIESMPGQSRLSLDLLLKEIGALVDLGIKGISLFPVVDDSLKDRHASESINPDGIYLKAIGEIKSKYPGLLLMTDVAMDPYSSDGHDGLVDPNTGRIENDPTLEILARMAIAQSLAGSDMVGPSDMMDGRVGYIRDALDSEGLQETQIISYTAKYASSFYGPFRDALDSAPKSGDKKTYQMDYANSKEALREARLDLIEGADILMVKPGIAYLDIVAKMKEEVDLPLAVYNVSGEYAMVMAAAQKGWIDAEAIMIEMMTAFKRAGADIILTYFAKEMAKKLF